MRAFVPTACFLLSCASAMAQQATVYDDFATPSLDTARWEAITEVGQGLAEVSTADGRLTITGKPDRTGVASRARLGQKAIIEVDAVGYTGINQIVQLYGGSGGFSSMIEFGIEGAAADGTPTLHIWTPMGEEWFGPAPSPGAYGPDRPLHLRVERNGGAYRLLVDGREVHAFTSDAIAGEARVVLYGFGASTSRWDNVRLSGPSVSISSPQPDTLVSLPLKPVVKSDADSTLEIGEGEYPVSWRPIGTGWSPSPNAVAPLTLRCRATDAGGCERSMWTTFTLNRAALWEPLDGQTVGPAFNAAVGGAVKGFVKARFTDNGKPAGECAGTPFHVRIVPKTDGPHVITAVLTTASGATSSTPPIQVTVRRGLYGRNTRVSGRGRAFVFPDGRVTVPIGFNDSYTWPGTEALFRTGDEQSAIEYVRMLRTNGVNVVRMFLEAIVPEPDRLLEYPLGHYNKAVVEFWDRFLPICERHGLTVLISPWDTFWINQPWSASAYNVANSGPCVNPHDFIVNPQARKWQKARIRTLIDRWGNSPAIFAIDLLNEHDIWWDATPRERKAWVDDMAQYTRDYELRKWGHVHMLTVSAAVAEPGGVVADITYRHPLFDFANSHLYYWGTVSDPKNVLDPAISFNHGVRYALGQIQDGRPYTDTESGPINRWIPEQTFDDQVFHHMSWAHLASGGAGAGMRWPYRNPHALTPVMIHTLGAISQVVNRINWKTFSARNADNRLKPNVGSLVVMGSGDARQAIVWVADDVRKHAPGPVAKASVALAGMAPGKYEVAYWDTRKGAPMKQTKQKPLAGRLTLTLPTFTSDIAVTIRPMP